MRRRILHRTLRAGWLLFFCFFLILHRTLREGRLLFSAPRAKTRTRAYMNTLSGAPQVFGEGNNIYELWIAVESFEMRAAPMISAAAPGVLPKVDIDVISDNDT